MQELTENLARQREEPKTTWTGSERRLRQFTGKLRRQFNAQGWAIQLLQAPPHRRISEGFQRSLSDQKRPEIRPQR